MRNRPAFFSALAAAYSILWFSGEECLYRLWYYVPASALAGSLVADRVGSRRSITLWQWVTDIAVSMLCLARPLYGYPPVSGHALFSIHAMMTRPGRTTMVLAIICLLITVYAKIVLWGWDVTLWPGLMAGVVSGAVCRLAGAYQKVLRSHSREQ